jgi:FkbM family methyltransferase
MSQQVAQSRFKSRLKRRVEKFIDRHFNGFTAEIGGKQFRIPVINNVWPKTMEKWMSDLIGRLLPMNPGVFVDVGVNTGQTLLKLRAIDSDVRYVGLEPNSTCINYVNRLIIENKFRNAEIIPVGASDKEGLLWLEFFANDESDSSASLVENFRPGASTGTKKCVPIARLDLIKSQMQLPTIGVLKIDVEGGELEVFRGMRETVKSDRPLIILEVLHAHAAERLPALAERVKEMGVILQEMDYVVFRVEKSPDDNKVTRFTPVPLFDVKVWDNTSWNQCDYLCVPREKSDRIK